MRIHGMNENQLAQKLRGQKEVETARGGSPARGKAKGASGSDTVSLSTEAKLLLELKSKVAELKEQMLSLPETRREKVDLARRRLASGYYARSEVKEKIAERLLESFGF